jgi:hypothetical protein
VTNNCELPLVYIWGKADWSGFNNACFETCWGDVFENCNSSNDYWLQFRDLIYHYSTQFVPTKVKSAHLAQNRKAPIKRCSKKVRQLTRKKKFFWRKIKKKKTDRNVAKYKKCIKLIKTTNKSDELKFESKIIKSNNVGAIYKHMNSRLTHKTGIAPLTDLKGQLVFNDLTKAELLNNHFVIAGTMDDGKLLLVNKLTTKLDSITFTEQGIVNVINHLKKSSAPGPDGIPSCLYKNLKHSFAQPLAFICNKIFLTGKIRDQWKLAIVTPILKKR